MKPKRPPPPPDLLEEANRQVPFGGNPFHALSILFDALKRGLRRMTDTPEKRRFLCEMISELTDMLGDGADDLIVVKHPQSEVDRKAKEPGPVYTPFTSDRPKP